MPRRRLTSDELMEIECSAFLTRHRYSLDPHPVVSELQHRLRDRPDLLAQVAGSWVGFYRRRDTEAMCAALLARVVGMDPWIEQGQMMAARSTHGTQEFNRPWEER